MRGESEVSWGRTKSAVLAQMGCGGVVGRGVGRRQGRGEMAKKEKLGPMVKLGSESMFGV